jgi:imidazolonepropionase-like amidohydrolase
MAEYGMATSDVIRAATTIAAKVLGREGELGRIAAGFRADLIAVRGSPLDELSVLASPVLVIRDGRIVVDRRSGGPSNTD